MGEILQLSGMHEDEWRAVVGYACQMGRWRGPDHGREIAMLMSAQNMMSTMDQPPLPPHLPSSAF